jgi:cellulose synthase/poly-beta-1,6-N-acetylglucosamine synthase-like glycosyltransferase
VNSIAYFTYRPIPLPTNPSYKPKDVTVVIPSLEGEGDSLRDTIRSALENDPFKIIIVTIDENSRKAQCLAASLPQKSERISVLSIPKANKRCQMVRALPDVSTEITVFADDDVIWPQTLLPWILSPFENKKVGAVGTSQRLRREPNPTFWTFLGAAYLLRRNWDIISCNAGDGGLPCLSGRTAAYRTEILQDREFIHAFTHETWGSNQLNADDDNFLTRWMMNNDKDIRIQKHSACEIQTTLEGDSKYLRQCLRWARSNWRSNIKSLFIERTIWRYVLPATFTLLPLL